MESPLLKLENSSVGGRTLMAAVTVLPAPPCVEVTVEVVLVCGAIAVPVTFTEKVRDAPPARDAPVSLIVSSSSRNRSSAHEPVKPFGYAPANPVGSVSVKPTPFSFKFGVFGGTAANDRNQV